MSELDGEKREQMHLHPFGHQLVSIILCLGFGVGDGVKARWSEKRGAPEGLDHPGWCGWKGKEFVAAHRGRI